jgi:NADH:ubiquinone reductase (H+-translocating)
VISGAGFGGLVAARALRRAPIDAEDLDIALRDGAMDRI